MGEMAHLRIPGELDGAVVATQAESAEAAAAVAVAAELEFRLGAQRERVVLGVLVEQLRLGGAKVGEGRRRPAKAGEGRRRGAMGRDGRRCEGRSGEMAHLNLGGARGGGAAAEDEHARAALGAQEQVHL